LLKGGLPEVSQEFPQKGSIANIYSCFLKLKQAKKKWRLIPLSVSCAAMGIVLASSMSRGFVIPAGSLTLKNLNNG
jgi:hypothetical protein